jgi:hypothetical protein
MATSADLIHQLTDLLANGHISPEEWAKRMKLHIEQQEQLLEQKGVTHVTCSHLFLVPFPLRIALYQFSVK